jgi:hypothetical protein
MEIIGIFVDEISKEGLYSVQYDGEDLNEWERLLDLWRDDTEYVTNYCADNVSYLSTPFFEGKSIQQIINKIRDEAERLEEYMYDFIEGSFTDEKAAKLQSIFIPLKNSETTLPFLQKTKFRYNDRRNFPTPLLRIYALRVGKNTFIITGGAIKLTRLMEEHPDTQRELGKVEAVRKYLLSMGIKDEEQLIYYYYESNE